MKLIPLGWTGWWRSVPPVLDFARGKSPFAFIGVAVPCCAALLMINPRFSLAEAEPTPSSTAEVKPGDKPDVPLRLDFMQLSFEPARDPVNVLTGQPHYEDQLPATIKGYDGRKVRIRGYMVPVKMEGNEVREFLIMASQMSCCYGTPPRFWEFIAAKMIGDPAPHVMDRPITFEGILKVKDVYEQGYWTQLYSMDCTEVRK